MQSGRPKLDPLPKLPQRKVRLPPSAFSGIPGWSERNPGFDWFVRVAQT